jgi:hypothetical protein
MLLTGVSNNTPQFGVLFRDLYPHEKMILYQIPWFSVLVKDQYLQGICLNGILKSKWKESSTNIYLKSTNS